MTAPVLNPTEAQSHQTFLALMWALTHPGRSQKWAENVVHTLDGLQAIGQALLDLETSFYTPDATLIDELARTTARPLPADAARYHFYPSLSAADLDDVAQASIGTMLYPDKGATLIIGCTLGQGAGYRLTGPGIQDETIIQIDGLPPQLWTLRQKTLNYPLGWDIILVDGAHLLGLPRTTVIERAD
jgi:alpha-D-ribose 1-methylphosphonate 5-triphosphate synthase subunit PhnH